MAPTRHSRRLSVKKSKAKPRDPSRSKSEGEAEEEDPKPKRPPGVFILFREAFKKDYVRKKRLYDVGKAASDKWRIMTDDEKAPYIDEAKKLMDQYKSCKQAGGLQASGKQAWSRSQSGDEDNVSEVRLASSPVPFTPRSTTPCRTPNVAPYSRGSPADEVITCATCRILRALRPRDAKGYYSGVPYSGGSSAPEAVTCSTCRIRGGR